MAWKCVVVSIFLCGYVCGQLCPRQCDCDVSNGLNRATCEGQNIISMEVGVPSGVQVYSLSHNVISGLENYCFKEAGITSIEVLNLSYNQLSWIGIHAFAGLDKLVHLDLSSNRLRAVVMDLFFETPVLEMLDLSGNVFEDLKNQPLIDHTKLKVLNLNNCRIKSLPDRLFTRLPNLRKLDLSENYLISLNTEVLKPLRKLERIELQNDYWNCDSNFMAVEAWITSRHISYTKKCIRRSPKMFEKMISATPAERTDVDVRDVWNITSKKNETLPILKPTRQLSWYEKIDKEFSSSQAFIIGLELGLAIGIVCTYVWLRSLCGCRRVNCTRPQTRRQRRRAQRVDGDMRTNLLWSSGINPDLETPPSYRRQLSLPERSPPLPYGVPGAREPVLHADAIRVPRGETPPPPYHECRINI
ncbi:leucine-rich repeat-containing protein 26 [Leguminivora glycinivorella]|uniref:leucine-rich repeat-containing protein 26 n=1 Tax=Leguminivora glycinivorella TaxID=1035111 RepID=UPI00200E2E59|nr:leucine-rich repeat-containing protein 26 [Leguminivora glycinivorella]